MHQLMHGDCLELMKDIPDGSIDMVLCDPPYGTIKGLNAFGWGGVNTSWDTKLPTKEVFELINQKVRLNGAIILFAQEPYTSHLITNQHGNLPFCYRMIWEKDHFANALLAKKAPVSYFEDVLVFYKKYDTQFKSPLREYSKRVYEFIGKEKNEIFNEMGNMAADHFLRHNTIQFSICTNETYNKLIDLYAIDKQDWFLSYEQMKAVDNSFKLNKTFNLPEGKKYKSNILKYKKDYSGYHPTQKPVALLEDLIKTYSKENQTILDFTMGSGSTGVACVNAGRKFIGIEKDDKYYSIAEQRIKEAQQAT